MLTIQGMSVSDIDQRLNEMATDIESKLTCPECNSNLTRADIVEIVAPDDEEHATKETYKNTVGGAGLGATLGAVAGPPGVVAGGALGSLLGGARGKRRRELKRVKVQCPHCGCSGSAC